MLILLDPAHGHNTPDKRSPDSTFLEYAYTRDLANQILAILKTKGHNAQLLVPETEDIPLRERVRRANAICTAQGPTVPFPVNVAFPFFGQSIIRLVG